MNLGLLWAIFVVAWVAYLINPGLSFLMIFAIMALFTTSMVS